MKIRTGFVSNSSSSSFVLTTTKENWEKAKEELEAFQITVAEAIMKEEKKPEPALATVSGDPEEVDLDDFNFDDFTDGLLDD